MAKKYIQEDITTATCAQGTLLIPRKIYDTLWQEVEKSLFPREMAALVLGPANIPGSSVSINLETADTMDVRQIGEGAEIWKDQQEWTTINIAPNKWGVRIQITTEMREDSQYPLLERSAAIAGKRMGENEQSIIISDALDQASNSASPGTALTISDLTTAMQSLEDNDFTSTDMLAGTEVVNDLRNIDTFVEADKLGSREMLQTGMVGTIFGMRVFVFSPNATPAPSTDKKDCYVIDRGHAYVIAEKRPVTIEEYRLATHDLDGVAITQRIAVAELRDAAVYKISTS